MISAADQPLPDPRRVQPYAMTGGRTRPTHDDLEIETLVSTTSVREQTPKLTVEQRAIAALCHEILSIAEVSAKLHLPLGVIRILVGDMADEHLVMVHRPAQAGDRPDLACWSGCWTGSTASDEHPGLSEPPVLSAHSSRRWLKRRAVLRSPTAGTLKGQPHPRPAGTSSLQKTWSERMWWARRS
jgi:Protein of unknown function (DUF742)